MRKFLNKLFIFGVLYVCVVCIFLVLSAQEKCSMVIAEITNSDDYAYEDFGANEIIPFIERVQEQNDYSKLIIGDSVCNQVFERYYDVNDVYCISGSNQAISVAGQYILAEEFIKNHKNVTDIYLLLTMGSLATDFDVQLGYQYAVMPFVKTATINYLDEATIEKIAVIYGGFFCQKAIVEVIHHSPLNMKLYLNMLAKKDEMFPVETDRPISEVTYKYLEKLYSLCEREGIVLHLIPGPHADSEERFELEEQIREELITNGDLPELEAYLDKIIYYPEELFRDGIHFDEEKVDDVFFQKLAQELVPEIKVK